MLLLPASGGCSRTAFRIRANNEVKALVTEKSNDPRWALADYTLEMDPRARYFDPSAADTPPMPRDDPAAHQFMHFVAGHRGSPRWHKWGDQKFLENPAWRAQLGDYVRVNEYGELVLTLEDAVKLARLHSDTYRIQLETIYLSALDVSTERFIFQTMFYGQTAADYIHEGTNAINVSPPAPITTQGNPVGGVSVPTVATAGTTPTPINAAVAGSYLQAQKFFPTGGQFVVELLNSFAWTVAGQNQSNYNSLLNFSLVQPLLRGAGRIVALETLTIVERTLLNNLRAMQRYRQGLYTNVAVGDNSGVVGPGRRGGLLGGTGLTGFTGQGITGLGGVGQVTNYGGSLVPAGPTGAAGAYGTAGLAGGGAGTVGGFLGLLQQLQQIRNTQDSLGLQLRTLGLLEANQQAGLIDISQVDQFRQNIESERANLLASQITLANALDNFKVGLLTFPPDVEMTLDDKFIQPFRLIDRETRQAQFDIEDFVRLVGDLPQSPTMAEFEKAVETLNDLRKPVGTAFRKVRADLTALRSAAAEREKFLDSDRLQAFRDDVARLLEAFADLETRFADSARNLAALRAKVRPDNLDRSTDELVDLATGISGLTQELSLVQARARVESVTSKRVDLDAKRAFAIARANRLDWMNNRAQLVDTWRLIAYNANALLSNFSLTFAGDLGTTGNNPVKFAGSTGSLRMGVQFDPPLTRRLERNNFCSALISYQQARRDLYQYYDGVNQVLRRILRTLKQLERNLEIQRRAVVIAVRRVDQTRELLNKPPEPVMPGGTAAQFSPTAAQNLLYALSDLRNAQNNFMSVWLNHHAQRMILMRELGLMELDQDGLWVDRPLEEIEFSEEEEVYMPPPVPTEWFRLAGVDDDTARKLLSEGIEKSSQEGQEAAERVAAEDAGEGDVEPPDAAVDPPWRTTVHAGQRAVAATPSSAAENAPKILRVIHVDALPASADDDSQAVEAHGRASTNAAEALSPTAPAQQQRGRRIPRQGYRVIQGPGS